MDGYVDAYLDAYFDVLMDDNLDAYSETKFAPSDQISDAYFGRLHDTESEKMWQKNILFKKKKDESVF